MHIFEVFIFILSMGLMWMFISNRTTKKPYVVSLLSLSVLFLTLHIIVDGSRWQLFTLYFVVLFLGIMVYLKLIVNIVFKNFVRRSIITVMTSFIVISIASAFVFPIYEMPTPNGEYLIGTSSYVIEDKNRDELYSGDSSEFRKIKIQIWYPAETIEGYERAPWLEDGVVVARSLSKDTGLPIFVLDHAVDIMSNSYIDAPISSVLDKYPVIIISHGWRGFRNLHSDFAEELASQGFVVVGIDHTYGSVATVFSDDDIAYLNLDALPERETTPDFLEYANQLVNTYAGDITTTINYLEYLNDPFHQSQYDEKLDLNNIGLIGHSTGGGGSVAVALNDNRIKSVLGLDAWVEPIDANEIDKGLTIPSLFIRSGAWEIGYNNESLYELIENSTYPSDFYQIDGTTHYDFAMVYMYSPLTKLIGFTGEVESEYLTSILKSMMTDFFNETLNNDLNSEIDSDTWEEVRKIIIP